LVHPKLAGGIRDMPTTFLKQGRKVVDIKAEHREGTTGRLIWKYARFEKPASDAPIKDQAWFDMRLKYEFLRSKTCQYLRSVELPEWVRTGEQAPTTLEECVEGIAKLNVLLKTGGKTDGTDGKPD